MEIAQQNEVVSMLILSLYMYITFLSNGSYLYAETCVW